MTAIATATEEQIKEKLLSKEVWLDEYYNRNDYLSNSALSNFVSFSKWTKIYNFPSFLNPTPPDSDAIEIGKAVDADLTENEFFLDTYEQKLSKDDLITLAEEYDIEYIAKKSKANPVADTMDSLTKKLIDAGHVFKKTMTKDNFEKTLTILSRANNFQYDYQTTYRQYIAESCNQMVITSDKLMMKGKFDHCNIKRKRISDLKTTGQFDKLLEEIYYGGNVNINHKYVRQLAIYRELVYEKLGEWWECELIIIGHNGKHQILRLPKEALDDAMAEVYKDIEELNKYRFPNNPKTGFVDDRENVIGDYSIKLNYTRYTPSYVVETSKWPTDLFETTVFNDNSFSSSDDTSDIL